MPFWDRTIDLVILTHPEHDHFAGLIEVLKRYDIDHALWAGIFRDTGEYGEWKRLLEQGKIDVKIARAGQIIVTPEVSLTILHPFEDLEGKEVKNTNNSSIALHFFWRDIVSVYR